MPNNQLAVRVLQTKDNLKAVFDNADFKEALMCVASKYMTPEKIMKIALLATSRNPDLFACTQASVLDAIITASEIGLDFAGASGQGYLIAYNNKNYPQGIKECKFMPGYQGFIELAYRNKQVTYIDAQVVYEKDYFEFDLGSDPFVKFKPYLAGDRGKVVCVFALARLKEADRTKIEILSADELNKIRNSSKAKNDGPWKWWESEMQRKSGIRRLWKYLPKTPEMVAAIEADNENFGELGGGAAASLTAGVAGLKERINGQNKPEDIPPAPEQIGPAIDETLEAKKQEQIDAVQQTEAADSEQQPEPEVVRWRCDHCDREFPHKKNNKCPHCFCDKIIDQKPPVESGEVPFGGNDEQAK